MTPLQRAMGSIEAAEALLMFSYGANESLAKGHLRIARLAVAEAQKQEAPAATGA